MKRIYIFSSIILIALLFPIFQCAGQSTEQKDAFANYHKYYHPPTSPDKEVAINRFREQYAKNGYSASRLDKEKMNWQSCIEGLTVEGKFKDLTNEEKDIDGTVTEAYIRLWKIADAYRRKEVKRSAAMTESFLKAIVYYGNEEISRANDWQRFHSSCFLIPTAAVNIYFCFLKEMDGVEKENKNESLLAKASEMLKVVALQAWTQPLRGDATDNNIVQLERFRKHVWWVGGNGIGGEGYRPVFPVACMYRSAPMIDLLGEVSVNGISATSQTTYNDSFWTEGFTADGAGWGHGKQSLVWGYPIHGTSGALNILNYLKNTPWQKKITAENVSALLNFFRGSNWYYYKGHILPCLDRGSMSYDSASQAVPYLGMINSLLDNWSESFTELELKELKQLKTEAETYFIQMKQYPIGMYNGSRWFYNNDDLIKKNDAYHLMVNMASSRCNGLESASFADNYNFYTADGMTLFQKNGNEYKSVYGGWDVTASPGVTAREGMDKLTPVTNWAGYNSQYNFAGAATSGAENSAVGFIFQKVNGSKENTVGNNGNMEVKNPILYGVKAYKSYFIIGDYMVALGAGITNDKPDMPGNIRTTIDQTALEDEVSVIWDGKEEVLASDASGIFEGEQTVWIKQRNKFAYTVLPQFSKQLFYACETKKADWEKMNTSNKGKKDLPNSVKILRIWVDHGQKPVNDVYGYAVYMGSGNPAAQLPVSVINNDSSLQAVESSDGKVVGAVFYSPNTVLKTKNVTLNVTVPCAVLLEQTPKGYLLTVTDPTMDSKLNEIAVAINGNPVTFAMPNGKDCGKPVSKMIEK